MNKVLLLLAYTVCISLTGCNRAVPVSVAASSSQQSKGGIEISAASLSFITVEAVGSPSTIKSEAIPGRIAFRPQALASIGAPVTGRISSIAVRPGETIKSGAPLIVLRSAEVAAARASLEQAHAKANAAEDLLKRQNEMVAKGIGLEVERFEAETRAREARAELKRAQHAVALIGDGRSDQIILRSPTTGIVVSVKTSVGAVVAPGGEGLIEIGDPSRLWVIADIAETDVKQIGIGQSASIRVPGVDAKFEGKVDGIGTRVEGDTRRLPIYIAFRNTSKTPAPGMMAEVTLTANILEKTITLPVTAVLIKDGQRKIVYVQRSDGRFEARNVRTGTSSNGQVAILEGLSQGERVVVKGALLLDGEAEQLL